MSKSGAIALAVIGVLVALIYFFDNSQDAEPGRISVVVSGSVMCEEPTPLRRIRSAVEESAFVRTAMKAECKRISHDVPYELVSKDEYGIIELKDSSADGRTMYARSSDVAYRQE